MNIEQLARMEKQLSRIPKERLLEIDDQLNRWVWPQEFGEAPDGWESMSCAEKYRHIRDWCELLESEIPAKERLRYHHIHNLHSTELQFEDWWDSEKMKALQQIQSAAEHQRNSSFANGVCVGASVIAIVISLIVLLMQLR